MHNRLFLLFSVLALMTHAGTAQAQAGVTVTAEATVPEGYQQPQDPLGPQPQPQAQPQPQPQAQPQPVQVQQPAGWQPAPLPAAVHTGFFMRFNIGGGFTGMRASQGGFDVSIRGAGPLFSLALGASVIPRLAIYGEMWSSIALSPTVDFSGSGSGTADNLVFFALGGGVSYYLLNNLYFGLSVGFGAASLATGGSSGSVGSTDGGLAVKVTIGKGWFLGPEWGIGVAGVLDFARLPDTGVDWSFGTIGAALTITKN